MFHDSHKDHNIDVFWDTQRMINSCSALTDQVRKTIDGTTIYPHTEELEIKPVRRFEEEAKVIVSNKRSYQAVMDSRGNGRSCVLNFASARKPGGGVLKGSGAQEESLCRCSTLYPSLVFDEAYEKFYLWNQEENPKYGSDGIIYSPDVIILKTDTSDPKRLPHSMWERTDVLTCAAPDFRFEIYEDKLFRKVMAKRIRRILQVASEKNVDNLILGAFGCGAFQNPPEVVAEIFKKELEPFMHSFRRIEFAILGFNDDPNYSEFKKVFG